MFESPNYLAYILTDKKMKLFIPFVDQYGKMFHFIVQNLALVTKIVFLYYLKYFMFILISSVLV